MIHPSADPAAWRPAGGQYQRLQNGRIQVGDIVGLYYAAWRVTEVNPVEDVDLSDDDLRDMAIYKPEYRERHRPYYLVLAHVNGPILTPMPKTLHDGTRTVHLRVNRPGGRGEPKVMGDRYQTCSCHGHPWPCQDVLLDEIVTESVARADKLAAKQAGMCWACNDPITSRQRAVSYAGENLDMPGGPPVRFHTRSQCWGSATEYELNWISVDPRRERILTWPKCSGTLVVHHDGSSECRSWSVPDSDWGGESEPDCKGHLTHDHGTMSSCLSADDEPCPRGCRREGHPGCRTTPRPERRDQLTLGGAS